MVVFHSEVTAKVEATYFELANRLLAINLVEVAKAKPALKHAQTVCKAATNKMSHVTGLLTKATAAVATTKSKSDTTQMRSNLAFQACMDSYDAESLKISRTFATKAVEAKRALAAAESQAANANSEVQVRSMVAVESCMWCVSLPIVHMPKC